MEEFLTYVQSGYLSYSVNFLYNNTSSDSYDNAKYNKNS